MFREVTGSDEDFEPLLYVSCAAIHPLRSLWEGISDIHQAINNRVLISILLLLPQDPQRVVVWRTGCWHCWVLCRNNL
jgi:hypothetical protein